MANDIAVKIIVITASEMFPKGKPLKIKTDDAFTNSSLGQTHLAIEVHQCATWPPVTFEVSMNISEDSFFVCFLQRKQRRWLEP